MAGESGYDYGGTLEHLEPFVESFEGERFSENQDHYGDLWVFKDHIVGWSFGVHKWKNYVYLRYRVRGQAALLP